MNKTIGAIIFAIAITSIVQGQDRPFCDAKCKASVAIYAAGSAADLASSANKRELNPVLRNQQGNFSLGRGAALKGGVFGLTMLGQKKHPKAMFWARIGLGIGFSVLAYRNARLR